MRIIRSKCARALALALFLCSLAPAQRTSLAGQVTDPSAAAIPDALVVVTGNGLTQRQQTDEQGRYTFANLPPGAYTVRVSKKGFAVFEVQEWNVTGASTLDVAMTVTMDAQKVDVVEDNNRVGVDPNSTAGALVIKDADLDALSDDPDQLAQDLQALAGPSAGPNGGQIFIDGFSGGRIPPKSSIREIRINQNPFSAEYDRLGFGRIEILTRPGADRFRGQIMTMFSDNVLNARNPFVSERSPFQSKMFSANAGGRLTRKSSFNFDVENRNIDENAVVNATILDANLLPQPFSTAIVTPQRRLNIVPRLDVQLNEKNTLAVRYAYSRASEENQGIGNFSLPTRAYDTRDRDHTLQLTETAVLSSRAINETRLQHIRSRTLQDGDNTVPTINVLESFTAGGAQIGLTRTNTNRWELHNVTTFTVGSHTWKWGGRLRRASLWDSSPQNFGGTFTFSGGTGPVLDANSQVVLGEDGQPLLTRISSLEQYRRTELFLAQGITGALLRQLGGGASQFTIAGGNPLAAIDQTDVGLFILDDWRLRPNFTLSYGLRYERQSNIGDPLDLSPRLSFAWGLGGGGGRQTRTVLRGGFGIFYDRVSENLSLQELRFNGVNQEQYIVQEPDFYPAIPSLTTLAANRTALTIRELDQAIRSPYIAQTALGVDRQLPGNTSLSVTYTFSRGVHMLRTRNLNAPLASGILPYGDIGNLYVYESTGTMRQNQLITNVSTRFNSRFNLFGFYMLNYARGDTDGVGSFPADNYDLSAEWGPTAFDVRHRLFLGGSVTAPGRVMLNPFITASSGQPFNITTGRDNNGDTQFNDRPAFATATAGGVVTPWGVFNPDPVPGAEPIPRNYGRAPSQFAVNMRLSRTWGFGSRGESGPDPNMMGGPGMRGAGGRGPGGGGPGGPPPGGMGGGGGRGPGGPGGMFGGADTGKRFNITLSVSARNLLNNVNLSTPVGNLSSPLFGESLSLAGGFGPMGASAASNRRLDFNLRFSF